MDHITEAPTAVQREHARLSHLYQLGDMRLVWVLEADLHALAFGAAPAIAPTTSAVDAAKAGME